MMYLKRSLDVGLSLLCLALLLPFMLLVSFLVLLDVGWPVLFIQKRPGLNGVPFRLVKFRTMRNALGEEGVSLPDDRRLTSFGSFLRKWSIDEIPELWNVFVGEMSLVGPRPLLMEYLPLYTERQSKRHLVRPGLTGLAQVSGRNSLSWEEKFELDVYYVENWSFALDLQIIGRTVLQVLSATGVSADGYATMPPFTGTSRPRGLPR